MTSDITPIEMTAFRIMAETGLSARDLAEMDLSEYARVTGRATPAESAIAALDGSYTSSVPQVPQQPPVPAQEPQQPPQGLDPNSDAYFHAWRAGRARGGEGKGVFDSVPSRSDEFADGVRRHAGRGALSSSNVTEAPRLTNRYIDHDAQRDPRSAAARFSTPGNANSF